jgi:hypothetical protein
LTKGAGKAAPLRTMRHPADWTCLPPLPSLPSVKS